MQAITSPMQRSGCSTEEASQRFLGLLREMGQVMSLRDPMGDFDNCELTTAQRHAVMWIGLRKGMTMSQLAGFLHTSTATCTGLADRLERDGFVERVRSEEDRRVVQLRLTEKGHGVFQRIEDHAQRRVGQLLSLVDDHDRAELLAILERAMAAARAHVGPSRLDRGHNK